MLCGSILLLLLACMISCGVVSADSFRSYPIGGYRPIDVNDSRVQNAAAFAVNVTFPRHRYVVVDAKYQVSKC